MKLKLKKYFFITLVIILFSTAFAQADICGEIDIGVVGASNTVTGASSNIGRQSFVDDLRNYCPESTFTVKAIGGKNASEQKSLYEQLPDALDMVIFSPSGNSLGNIPGNIAALQEMLVDAHNKNRITVVLSISPRQASNSEPGFNQQLQQLKNQGFIDFLVDTYSVLEDEDDPGACGYCTLGDSVHWDSIGDRLVADAILESAFSFRSDGSSPTPSVGIIPGRSAAQIYTPTTQPSTGSAIQSQCASSECREIDEAWQRFAGQTSSTHASQVWNLGAWADFLTVYPPPLEDTRQSRTTFIESGLSGPSVWCTGNEGLPSTTYQNKINQQAWNSNGKTLNQLAIETGNSLGMHPATLATHMVLENSMRVGPHCTDSSGVEKSALTGCGWPGSCAGASGSANHCSCSSSSVVSDQAQLQCTATDTYLRNGELRTTGAYEKCNGFQSNPDQHWKCLLCVYQGNYDHDVRNSDRPYFTRDGTCNYADNFGETYCKWRNYFAQQGIDPQSVSASIDSHPGTASSITNVARPQRGNNFRFVVIGDSRNTVSTRSEYHYRLMSAIANLPTNKKPDFVLNAGDMTFTNADVPITQMRELWQRDVFTPASYILNQNIGYYPAFGNHDTGEYDWAWHNYISNSNVQAAHRLPYNYAFAHGNSYFISFDNYRGDENVVNWLAQQVNSAQNYEHIFTIAHIPLSSVKDNRDSQSNQKCNRFGPAMKDKITLFFAGHQHVFDYQVIAGESPWGRNNAACTGIRQVITGGGGASLSNHHNGGSSEKHFMLVEVNGPTVRLTKWDLDGNVVQQVPMDQRWVPGNVNLNEIVVS